jgi:hypothetical protein
MIFSAVCKTECLLNKWLRDKLEAMMGFRIANYSEFVPENRQAALIVKDVSIC